MVSGISNWNRISGLASGMDTESIVEKLMAAERIPLDRMEQKKQTLEWQRDAYREMNALLLELRNITFDMKLQGSYLSREVTSSHPDIVTATGSPKAVLGTNTVEVLQLAKGVTKTSITALLSNRDADGNIDTSSLKNQFGVNGTISFSINNETFTFDTDTTTIYDVVQQINKRKKADGSPLGVTASYDANLDRFFLTTPTGSKAEIKLSGSFLTDNLMLRDTLLESTSPISEPGKTSFDPLSEHLNMTGNIIFTLNGKTFSYDLNATPNLTLNDIIDDINSSGIGVSASYDGIADRFVLEGADIQITDTSGFLKNQLNIEQGYVKGREAKVIYNGTYFTSEKNDLTINGVTLNLKSASPNTQVSLNVTNNSDKTFDKIVKFIGKYNEIIGKINAKISEKKYRDYPPLTEKQKEEMSEKQIELWEKKAKSGIIQRDSMLSEALSQFRLDLSNSVEGLAKEMDSMFDLGFKTGEYESNGQIIIDENKLKEALNEHPDQVMMLFTKTHDTDHKQRGLAARLYESIDKYMDQLTEKAGSNNSFSEVDNSFLGDAIDELEEDMKAFENRLIGIENRYWRQFTAMEKAIQRANMQSGWLMQQFGGGQ